jgi:drug/metabolite transporter (DMT)-like permease
VRRRLWVALALALAGLVLVVELPTGISLSGFGVAAALGGAVAYAFYVLMADRSLKDGRDATSLLALGFLFAGLFWAAVQPWWSFPDGVVGSDASLLGRRPARTRPSGFCSPSSSFSARSCRSS